MPTFALVDCNSFFCACERVFQPKLRTHPVIVLSNNDGCVVSRTKEAKDLGVPMAVPFFKIKELVRRHGVAVFSSNYGLYADMSHRVMATLTDLAPALEIYSIDEAFLDLTGVKDVWEYARHMARRVLKDPGIPVSIGLGPTKTLAKIANFVAKKVGQDGVFDLTDPAVRAKILPLVPCHEVWGVGRGFTKTLASMGISSAWDIAQADPKRLRKTMGIVGERLCLEMQGVSCLSLEDAPAARKSVISSRSFGRPLQDKELVRKSLQEHVGRACEKLRKSGLTAGHLTIFIQSNRFVRTGMPHTHAASHTRVLATQHTPDLAHDADMLFERIWKENIPFVKAGVMLCALKEASLSPANLFDTRDLQGQERLMRTIDSLTKRHGRRTVSFASTLIKKEETPTWHMRSNHHSPCYTRRWEDLATVR